MTPGGRRVVLLGFVSAATVAAAAAGWFSPAEEALTAAQAPPVTTTVPPATTTATSTAATTTTAAPTTTSIPGAVTSAAPTTPDPAAPRSLSVLLTGDILTENPVLEAGQRGGALTGTRYDFAPVFAPIRPLIESYDLAICQMEIPIGRPDEEPGAKGRSPNGGNLLLAPYEMAPSLHAAGFDRCTTASNHSYDLGDAGITSTLDALDAVGISSSGTARTPEESPPAVFDIRNIRVAHVSYTRRSNTTLPQDEWRLAHTEDPARVAADVAAARQAGAEIVIVSIHVFKELTEDPISENRAFAEAVTASADIDALVHHGPHVVQGFETVNGTPVWWSIGNLLSGMARPGASDRYTDPRTRDGLGAVLRFTEVAPGGWEVAPSSVVLCNEASSRTIYAGVAALADPALAPDLRQQLEGCVERTRAAVPEAS